jgi:hypothetical protein
MARIMNRIWIPLILVVFQTASGASALERIKKKPTAAEADRAASDQAMTDSSLQKGDIVSTDRGFFVYRGVGADGYTNDFVPVANPLLVGSK